MTYKSNNLPCNMFYSAIGAGTLCIAKANNNVKQFYPCVSPLIFTMIKQGAHNDKLSNKLIFLTDINLLPR